MINFIYRVSLYIYSIAIILEKSSKKIIIVKKKKKNKNLTKSNKVMKEFKRIYEIS